MKRLAAFFCLCMVLSVNSYAQTGFQKGRTWIGPTIGYAYGGIGFGVGGEYGITPNIGLGAEASYVSFTDEPFPGFGLDYTLVSGLAAASYHFLPNEQFDPYIKLGVGYFNWDVKFKDDQNNNPAFTAAYASGVGITGQLGARYSITPSLDLRASVGFPFYIAAGVDYAFGGVTSSIQQKDSNAAVIAQQGNTTPASDKYSIAIGPYINGKGSIPIAVREGYKISPGFNPDFGITALFPFGKQSSIGAGIDLGYASYTYSTKPENSEDLSDAQVEATTIKEKYSYINFSPYLNLGGFTLGINFGFPSSAEATDLNDNPVILLRDTSGYAYPAALNKDASEFLATLMEARVGGMIPIFSNETGKLNINIQAGYVFSGLYNNYRNYYGAYETGTNGNNNKAKEDLNPTPVTLSLGLSYLFNLGF